MPDDIKRNSRQDINTYQVMPISERGPVRQVVNLPTERIRKLLDLVDALEEWMNITVNIIATEQPDLIEKIPVFPDMSYAEKERLYQQIRGKYNEANRNAMRVSRLRSQQTIRDQAPTVERKAAKPTKNTKDLMPSAERLRQLAIEQNEFDPLKGLPSNKTLDPNKTDLTALRGAVLTEPLTKHSYSIEELMSFTDDGLKELNYDDKAIAQIRQGKMP